MKAYPLSGFAMSMPLWPQRKLVIEEPTKERLPTKFKRINMVFYFNMKQKANLTQETGIYYSISLKFGVLVRKSNLLSNMQYCELP